MQAVRDEQPGQAYRPQGVLQRDERRGETDERQARPVEDARQSVGLGPVEEQALVLAPLLEQALL